MFFNLEGPADYYKKKYSRFSYVDLVALWVCSFELTTLMPQPLRWLGRKSVPMPSY